METVTTQNKYEYFLKYNKLNIFQALLQAETHLRNLQNRPGHLSYDEGHASCVLKHLAEALGEAREAQSHSLELNKPEVSKKFGELSERLNGFIDKLQQGKTSPDEALLEVRSIRRYFESFNPEYDVSKCKACGVKAEEVLAKLPKSGLAELEEETAHRIIEHLSTKYNVPKPKLKILDQCPSEPTQFGLFQVQGEEPQIVLCRGSADVHKIAHEFGHYLQFLNKKPLDEAKAEQFAIKEAEKETVEKEKPLYVKASHTKSGGKMTWRETGLIVGGQHIFKGVEKAADYIDTTLGKSTAPVTQRPSTWINTIGGLALILLPRFIKVPEMVDILLTAGGGYLTTRIWDYIEEYRAGAATAGGSAYSPVVSAPTSYVPVTPTPTPEVVTPTPTAKVY